MPQNVWEQVSGWRDHEIFAPLAQQLDAISPSSGSGPTVNVPITVFHDLAAILSEKIIRHVRHRAGQAARDTTDTYSAAQA